MPKTPTPTITNSPRSKVPIELYSSRLVDVADTTTQLNYGSWFIFKGNIHENITRFFGVYENYFYAASFLTNGIAALLYVINFMIARNKNATKAANLALRFFSLSLLFIMSFGAVALGPEVVLAALGISVLIYPVIHTLKAIYFAYRCLMAETQALREFFFEKVKYNVLVVAVCAVMVVGLVALYSIPGLNIAVMMGIAVIGASVVTVAQGWKMIPFIKGLLGGKEKTDTELKDRESEYLLNEASSTKITAALSTAKPSTPPIIELDQCDEPVPVDKSDFYRNAIIPDITDLEAYERQIVGLQRRYTRRRDECGDHLFSAAKKFDDKIKALDVLRAFMHVMDKAPASAPVDKPFCFEVVHQHYKKVLSSGLFVKGSEKKIELTFDYKSKDELVIKIEKYIYFTYPAYQSFAGYRGDTQLCFDTVFKKFRQDQLKEDDQQRFAKLLTAYGAA